MSNHVRLRDLRRGGSRSQLVSRFRRERPKTFKTEDAAKQWAEKNGTKSYTLVNLRSEESSVKKLRVLVS